VFCVPICRKKGRQIYAFFLDSFNNAINFSKKNKKRAALFWYGSFYLKSFQKIKKRKVLSQKLN